MSNRTQESSTGLRRDWLLHQSTNQGEQQAQAQHSMWVSSSSSSSGQGKGQLFSSIRAILLSRAKQCTQATSVGKWYMSRSTRYDSRQTAAARLNQAGG